jgi:hypothetical protein
LYKKLDEFGQNHTKSIKDAVLHQGKYMALKLAEARKQSTPTDSDTLLAQQDESHAGTSLRALLFFPPLARPFYSSRKECCHSMG